MIFAFIAYIIFSYIFVSKQLINLCTITLFYIMIGIYVGEASIGFSAKWVRLENLSYVEESIYFLKTGFYLCVIFFVLFQFYFREYRLKKSSNVGMKNLFVANVSWGLIVLLAIPLYVVFLKIYFPVFEERTFISKYFQDRLQEFIPFRPFYTLSLNALSTILFLQINYFLSNYTRVSFFKLIKNKQFLKLLFIVATLFFTAKRGQLFLPIFISIVAYLIYKKHLLKLIFSSSFIVIIVGVSRNFKELLAGELSLEHTLMTLSTSFFVSVRELSRVLLAFKENAHDFVYGKTYLAGFFSFIPTKINSLKANYNYMRYSSIISNQNPDEFGGMRSTYLGEAYVNFGNVGLIIIPFLFALIVYLAHLFIRKYATNNFVYYIMLFWIVKMLVLPLYENGSSMFLFFLITLIFMFICSLKIVQRGNKTILKLTFLKTKKSDSSTT